MSALHPIFTSLVAFDHDIYTLPGRPTSFLLVLDASHSSLARYTSLSRDPPVLNVNTMNHVDVKILMGHYLFYLTQNAL